MISLKSKLVLSIISSTILFRSGASFQENYRKTTEVVRSCDNNEIGAHSEKNATCGHTSEKKKTNVEYKLRLKRDYD